MGLLDQLWDDTVAGPRPENGLGKLRKYSSFSFRPNSGKGSDGGNGNVSVRSYGEEPPEEAVRVTRSIMIVKPPGVFCRKTCCDAAQTHPALLTIRKLASTGEASQECLQLWELLECSICDPRVGVQPGPPLICTSFCDRVFGACSDAYFSMETVTQVLAPCGVNDFVCGRASQWVHNGTELCHAAGLAVKDDAHVEEKSCYGSKASLDLIADSWKASRSVVLQKGGGLGVLDDFQQWAAEMPFSERVSWAVGGMVLTAGLLFLSKRKNYSQRQKLAGIQRTAKKLETKKSQKSPGNQGNKKGR
ncbi:hypothetical protein L484_001569 [Morus notabilis]|uniref:Folate receptor-like domain-containing protein n=1 Tax=Morus notabilis TaxID=981085 RepID=W9RZ38_9ROSA|nr:hypothetical protein L484_001569 [Morus notabilis]